MKTYKEWMTYRGDSNPMKLSYVDIWHHAQKIADSNREQAINLMKKAANLAMETSPGEAKYYLATMFWLNGDYNTTKKYMFDKDVITTGNHNVLKRLLNNNNSSYSQAYN